MISYLNALGLPARHQELRRFKVDKWLKFKFEKPMDWNSNGKANSVIYFEYPY